MANNSTKRRTSAKQRKEELRRAELKRNITILGITAVLGIFLFLANFGIIGFIGNAVSGFFFGLFGSFWYVLPLVIIALTFVILFRPHTNGQIIGTVGFCIGLSFLISLIQSKSAENVPFSECFALGLNEHKGGILALWPSSFVVSLLGKPGSWILAILILIASFVALVGFSNLVDFSDRFNEWSESDEHQERLEYRRQKKAADAAMRRAERIARQEERLNEKTPRMENKAYGVEFDSTNLKETKTVSTPEINIPVPNFTEETFNPSPINVSPANFTDNLQEVTLESMLARNLNYANNPQSNDIFSKVDTAFNENIDFNTEDENELDAIIKRNVAPTNFSVPNNSAVSDGSKVYYESPEEKWNRLQKEKQDKMRFEQSLASDVSSFMDKDEIYPIEKMDAPVIEPVISEPEISYTEPVLEEEFTVEPIAHAAYEPVVEEPSIEPVSVAPVTPVTPAKPEPSKPVEPVKKPKKAYVLPPIDLLNKPVKKASSNSSENLEETRYKLENTLRNFGVDASVVDVTKGPSVTRFEIEPAVGVKVSKIVNLSDDIKLNLAVADIRIEAPIPGKSAVGIEVPNKEAAAVPFREMVESPEFTQNKSKIAFGAGRDIAGAPIISDIAKMPHVLIAGATGSGKSVCINTIIMSILYKATPDDVKMIMVDPKVVELSVYNGIPHLMLPVVTEPKKASAVLQSAVVEMENRFKLFAEYGVRDLAGFNQKRAKENIAPLPQIVIIVDELADLMMVAGKEVEESICRIAQLARACGMHLIIATQRPSVNVITGLIKANMPSRIAFAVTSGIDSRTILDMTGAEKLLGKGDMLYFPQNLNKPIRAQGAFVTDEEVSRVVDFIVNNNEPAEVDEEILKKIEQAESATINPAGNVGSGEISDGVDQLLVDAGRFIIEKNKASIGSLQRQFRVGFNRAARIMDQLCANGVVGPEEGTKPRMILMTLEEFDAYVESGSLQ